MTGLPLRRRQLGDQKVQEDRELLPAGVAVGQDRGEEAVGADERLGLALEVHLAVLVESVQVDRHAGIEDRVELVAVGLPGTARPTLRPARPSYTCAVQRGLQVVQLVRVGLLG